jgi:hypothetical protein
MGCATSADVGAAAADRPVDLAARRVSGRSAGRLGSGRVDGVAGSMAASQSHTARPLRVGADKKKIAEALRSSLDTAVQPTRPVNAPVPAQVGSTSTHVGSSTRGGGAKFSVNLDGTVSMVTCSGSGVVGLAGISSWTDAGKVSASTPQFVATTKLTAAGSNFDAAGNSVSRSMAPPPIARERVTVDGTGARVVSCCESAREVAAVVQWADACIASAAPKPADPERHRRLPAVAHKVTVAEPAAPPAHKDPVCD